MESDDVKVENGKRKAEDYPEGEEARLDGVVVDETFEEEQVEGWVCEIEAKLVEEEADEEKNFNFDETAWDDVKGEELDPEQVRIARKEEIWNQGIYGRLFRLQNVGRKRERPRYR